MKQKPVDLTIVGAGPVGLMCAYLAKKCGMTTVILDKSEGPLKVGRADALNARTLQLLEVADLFDELYPIGKTCNTSSVWAGGKFVSRQSTWWDELEGCLHKHFLMLGQAHIERLVDGKLKELGSPVRRSTAIESVEVTSDGCTTGLHNGEKIHSRYVIGADGSRSFVREHFKIPFEIVRPQIVWAVIDGVIETDFPKVPEIIVFQAETSDVAWIPREGSIDRFYVRMDAKDFTLEESVEKINRAMKPHTLKFKEIEWFSQFSVKESVAEKFFVHDRVFLAGDACHIHSVNGGQGLNTGLADAFNLIWKLNMVLNFGAPQSLLKNYEAERKPVAQSVIESSGELVRSTKFSESGTHAEDYVRIVQKRAGNITGMGIRYGKEGIKGSRLLDSEIFDRENKLRLYSLLDYSKFTLFVFGEDKIDLKVPEFVNVHHISTSKFKSKYWTESANYSGQAVLVRPDSYVESNSTLKEVDALLATLEPQYCCEASPRSTRSLASRK